MSSFDIKASRADKTMGSSSSACPRTRSASLAGSDTQPPGQHNDSVAGADRRLLRHYKLQKDAAHTIVASCYRSAISSARLKAGFAGRMSSCGSGKCGFRSPLASVLLPNWGSDETCLKDSASSQMTPDDEQYSRDVFFSTKQPASQTNLILASPTQKTFG